MSMQIEGMRELEASIRRLGNLPQRDVTNAARAGAKIALQDTRKNAPMKTGALRKGIILKGEKSRFRGKKVYQVTFDPAMNEVFQKRYGTGNKYAYYPASQEYGFKTKGNGYKEGKHFMRDSIVNNYEKISRKIVEILSARIDRALRR